VDAHNEVYLITIGTPPTMPTVTTLASMTNARAFHNGVVLPNGKIFVTGGQTHPLPFSDATTVSTPELWDPATQSFTILPPHAVPRNYHSVAILMVSVFPPRSFLENREHESCLESQPSPLSSPFCS